MYDKYSTEPSVRIQMKLSRLNNPENKAIGNIPGREVIACQKTLGQIITHFKKNEFIFPEEYQRGQVTTWKTFGRQWMTTLFSQDGFNHFDKLHFCEKFDDQNNITYQVVEGGQRLRSIYDFFKKDSNYSLGECIVKVRNGKTLTLTNFTYEDLKKMRAFSDALDEYLDEVLNERKFDISVYRKFSMVEIADIFGKINRKTPLNDQELRNAFGGEACISIRKTARCGAEEDPTKQFKLHPIFETIKSKDGKFKGRWIKFSPQRYEYEKTLAEFCLFENDYDRLTNFAISKTNLDVMYHNYSKDGSFKNILNDVRNRLDIIYKMVNIPNAITNSKQLLTKGDMFIVYGVLYHIEKHYFPKKEITYSDPRKFYNWIMKHHKKLCVSTKEFKTDGTPVETNYSLKIRTSCRTKDDINAIFQNWDYIFKDNSIIETLSKNGVTIKDKRRSVSDREALNVYVNQDGKDAITNEITPIDSLVKGHKIAHALGGETNEENTIMINSYDNQKQGTKTLDEYLKNK